MKGYVIYLPKHKKYWKRANVYTRLVSTPEEATFFPKLASARTQLTYFTRWGGGFLNIWQVDDIRSMKGRVQIIEVEIRYKINQIVETRQLPK